MVVTTYGRLKGGDVKQHYYIMEQTTTIEVKMNNCFNHFNNENINAADVEPRMTSLEIATLTDKPHNDVLKAIRKMEPAWEKVQGGKFSLLSRSV